MDDKYVLESHAFEIPSKEDRERMVLALANSGYFVRVIDERVPHKAKHRYLVEFATDVEEEADE